MMAEAANLDGLFHALGDKTRRTLLDLVVEQPRSVSQLAAALGVTLTAVGQHLEILEAAGLVRTEKLGRVRTCRLDPAGLDALEAWIGAHRTEMEKGLDRLGELLGEGGA
ncbi:MAG: ArsR/SmtB family transcription factor [Acidobacteriota bacterium]